VSRRFGGTYRPHLQGRKIRERGTSVSKSLQNELPVENNQLYKDRMGGRVSYMGNPKRRFTQELHGATSHKTALFKVTAVKISNLTQSLNDPQILVFIVLCRPRLRT
jgi:hypothetical protein